MLTADQLQSIMSGASSKRNRDFLPFLQAAMAEFAIESPARVAAFVAQLAHESGQFRFMEEIWGPTPAQSRYEPPSSLATDLGNTEVGDGKRFKGRGPIQITGRANYQRFGDLLRMDLVSNPPLAAVPDVAFRIAGLFWSKKGLNELADQATADAFRQITRRINGGLNGLAERQAFYAVACTVLGVLPVSSTRGPRQARPIPRTTKEPMFERGADAIRIDVRRARTRQRKLAAHRTKTRRTTTEAGPRGAGIRRQVPKAAATARRRAGESATATRKASGPKSTRRKR